MELRFTSVPATIAVAASVVAGLSVSVFGPMTAVISCMLGWTMVAIAVIDARRMTIPDILSLPALAVGLLASSRAVDPSASLPVYLDHAIGAGAGGAGLWLVRETYWHLRKREGLGLGDVKLAAAGGAWVGWINLPNIVLLAAVAALGFAALGAVIRRSGLSGAERIAFGAFLAPSIWIVWALGAYADGG